MASVGKQFEQAIKDSVPDDCLVYRLPDPASAFGQGNNLRFSKKNPFDFIIWNPATKTLFALELKTVAGKSISFERERSDNGTIHKHQIDGLREWAKYGGVVAGFVIEFRENETTVFLDIDMFDKLEKTLTKKSFNLGDLSELAYTIIPQKKLRTRYKYDLTYLLNLNSKEDTDYGEGEI